MRLNLFSASRRSFRQTAISVLSAVWLPGVVELALGTHVATLRGQVPNGRDALKATPQNTYVGKVNNIPIMLSELEMGLQARLKGRKVDKGVYAELTAEVIEELIDQKLVLAYVLAWPGRATDQEIDLALDEVREKIKAKDPKLTLEIVLEKSAQPMEMLRKRILMELSWKKYVAQNSTREDLDRYYQDHLTEFNGSQIRVKHLILRPVKTGDERETQELMALAARIKAAIDAKQITFDEAVQKHSQGPSRRKQGDLGWINRDGPMVEPFSKAAFALKTGEISPPTITPFGVHLIQLTEIKAGEKGFDDVLEKVQAGVEQHLLGQIIAEHRATAKVEISNLMPHFEWGTKKLVMPSAMP